MPNKTKENKGKKRVFNRISELKCVYCGKDFKSLRSNSLYCGGTCKNYACRDRKTNGRNKQKVQVLRLPHLEPKKPLEAIKMPLEVKKNSQHKEQIKVLEKQAKKMWIDWLKDNPEIKKNERGYDIRKDKMKIAHEEIRKIHAQIALIKKANRKPRVKKVKT